MRHATPRRRGRLFRVRQSSDDWRWGRQYAIRYARYDNRAVAITAFAGFCGIENDSVNVAAFLRLKAAGAMAWGLGMEVIEVREDAGRLAGAVLRIDGYDHPVTVSSPFDTDRLQEFDWYFEQHLRFPFTDQVRARQAGESITAYGEALSQSPCQCALHTFKLFSPSPRRSEGRRGGFRLPRSLAYGQCLAAGRSAGRAF